jgi:hypothetical protein
LRTTLAPFTRTAKPQIFPWLAASFITPPRSLVIYFSLALMLHIKTLRAGRHARRTYAYSNWLLGRPAAARCKAVMFVGGELAAFQGMK